MDVPRWPLDLTDPFTDEFEKAETESVNQHTIVREASEQIESPWSSHHTTQFSFVLVDDG
jgi:hypothetical protein